MYSFQPSPWPTRNPSRTLWSGHLEIHSMINWSEKGNDYFNVQWIYFCRGKWIKDRVPCCLFLFLDCCRWRSGRLASCKRWADSSPILSFWERTGSGPVGSLVCANSGILVPSTTWRIPTAKNGYMLFVIYPFIAVHPMIQPTLFLLSLICS